ncbi:26S proteasome regulatory subunit n6 [Globisporangium polare]
MTATQQQDVEMTEPEVVHQLQLKFEDAAEIVAGFSATSKPDQAIQLYQEILSYHDAKDAASDEVQRVKEHSIYKLGQLYIQYGREKEVATLLQSLRPYFATVPKAKTGKIVRTIIDMVAKVKVLDTDLALQLQADLCLDSIDWCNREKHTFLRQRVEARLASIYFQQQKFQIALDLINKLLREIKKLDDKQLLVEIHLVESKLHHALRNVPKAKAALTAARSISNAIYVVPKTQAQIDEMSGILHAEEHDYKTAYSYFFESFEALATIDEVEALSCLKYMLLAKIASGGASDVNNIVNSKQAIKFVGIDVEALKAVAKAHEQRSLQMFEEATKKYAAQLVEDPLIKTHLGKLYEQLLESNLIKIIQPFSCVEIEHVAKLIKLPLPQIELKLSQMILDHKFHGILDQGKGQLIVYESALEDKTYTSGLGVIENVGNIVDSLFRRADKLHA